MATGRWAGSTRDDCQASDAEGSGAEDAPGTTEAVWARIVERIRQEYGEDVYRSWFKGVAVVEADEFTVHLSVPTQFLRMWLRNNYGTRLLALWRAERPSVQRVDIRVRGVATVPACEKAPAEPRRAAARDALKVVEPSGEVRPPRVELPAGEAGGLESAPLDPRFRFDSFATGDSNKIAHDTAFAVAAAAASGETLFNPLFIHGGVGRGKTHLLHAIAWRTKELGPGRRVLHLSAEQFVFRFVSALRADSAIDFKDRLRQVDLLLIDDLQFLQGKATHREFGHTMNALIEACRQVVIVADRSPAELEGFDERTRSRLAGGLVAGVGQQEFVLRRRILEARAAALGRQGQRVDLPDEVLEYVAKNVSSNGRELEGAINRLAAHQCYAGVPVTVELAEKVIRDLVSQHERAPVKIEDIQRVVSSHYQLSRQDLVSSRRNRAIVLPRQVAMYLAKTMTPRSLPEIGRRFGNRDHTTVLHAIRKIEKLLGSDGNLARDVETLKRRVEDGEA
ncbi:Chromosomal replication initiator protein DnaA [Lutibaculum baratangense AMV1]|uniref:Chromosomal replication initiator protein DnaA n=1 Tax=Lutibaculum baratangense AMV1 TaxID=631454 RepID=V4RRQ2_9HYPH|nr:Chromosomal replication initiator protein DnaA [Lutibaculum baratangense AMV1]